MGQPTSRNDRATSQLNSFDARRRNCQQVLVCTYADPTTDSAAEALEAALNLHGLTLGAARCARLTGRAFTSDSWPDGYVYLGVYELAEGRERSPSAPPDDEYRLTVEQAVSAAWLVSEVAEGECWGDEVEVIVSRVLRGERAPLLPSAEAA